MEQNVCNYAFIDSQNLNLGIQSLGWKLDYYKFRIHLTEKYDVQKAYMFLGFVASNQKLYDRLGECDFILKFKPVTLDVNGKLKGNVDAELVLSAMIEYPNYDKAVIVSGDGDFFCLAEYFKENQKLRALIVPDKNKYSALLKKVNTESDKYVVFLENARIDIEYTHIKKKAPQGRALKELFRGDTD